MTNKNGTKISTVSLILSLLALFFAIVAFFHAENTTDFGLVIAALTILITVLIGWQISQTLTIKDEYQKLKNEYQNQLQRMADDINNEFKDAISDTTELILLRYADRESQLVVQAIYNLYRYKADQIQCKLSFAIINDLLYNIVEDDTKVENIIRSVDKEWLYQLALYIEDQNSDYNNQLEKSVDKLIQMKGNERQNQQR